MNHLVSDAQLYGAPLTLGLLCKQHCIVMRDLVRSDKDGRRRQARQVSVQGADNGMMASNPFH